VTVQARSLARIDQAAVPMRDGEVLAVDVYRPPTGSTPTILLRTPYDRQALQDRIREVDPLAAVRRGFAVVIQDLRGRFGSNGQFEALVPDVTDGADTVRWIRRQPWSDGRVTMVGGSYDGCVQFQAARARPEGLLAIAPTVSGSLRTIWHPGGALRLAGIEGWMTTLLVDALEEDISPRGRGEIEDLLDATPLERFHAFMEAGTFAWQIAAPLRHCVTRPRSDRYWTETTAVPRNPLPAVHTTGYYDLCCEAALDAYAAWSAVADPNVPQWLTLGPWDHELGAAYPDLGLDRLHSPPGLMALDRQMEFFDTVLGRRSVPEAPPVMSFVLGRDRWHEDTRWPPAGVQKLDLALMADEEGDGRLVTARSGVERTMRYLYDPRDPVPTLGGAHVVAGLVGPIEQAPIESRHDVLIFTSSPFGAEVEIAGAPMVRLAVASSAPATDFIARLTLVRPDGRSLPLVHGIWSGLLAEIPLVASRSAFRCCEIRLGSIHLALAPGERLRLQVTSSCYPDIYPNPNTGHDISLGPPLHVQVAEQALLAGGLHGSSLSLPVCGALPIEAAR
jgi:putative CocE/NonD family hydrolase